MKLIRDTVEPPLSRSGLVLALYGALSLLALLISAGREDVDIYRIEGTSTVAGLMLSPLLGVLVGLAAVLAWRLAVRRYVWAQRLHQDFRSLLGPLTSREILILALASAVGEELLFRGALQPWIGIWPQAAVFALLHVGPGRRFLPWTATSFALAIGFGYLFEWTGDLGGPIAAHFTINYLNLHFIARVEIVGFAPSAPKSVSARTGTATTISAASGQYGPSGQG
ncbi:MAG: hypothetical protein Tsb0020_50490 [Haliangiales bacterium]